MQGISRIIEPKNTLVLAMGPDWCIKAGLDIWRWKKGTWKAFTVI